MRSRIVPAVAWATAALLLHGSAGAQGRATSVVRSGDLVWADRYSPRFSPDGRALAYVEETHLGYNRSQRAVWVLDLGTMVAGCASREGGGIDPAWSEDGSLIAYIEPGREDPLRGRVYVAERSGSGRRPVTAHEDAFEPTWMFGSGRIVYLRHTAEGGGLRNVVCTIKPGGEDYQEVRSWPIVEQPGDVEWSRSGRFAAYWIRAAATQDVGGAPGRVLTLRLLNLETKEERNLPLPPDTLWVGRMVWSPDDKYIGIEATFDKNRTEIWAIPAAPAGQPAEPRRITASKEGESFYFPAWSGNGIVCVKYPRPSDSGKAALPELILADFDSRVTYPLKPDWARPVDPSEDIEMVSSPDGRMVVVASGAELRFLELGTEAERNRVLAEDQIRRVARALVRYSFERNGGVTPSPRNLGGKPEGEYFWVDLIKDLVRPEYLRAPGDTDTKSPSSYMYPKEAYNLDARPLSGDSDRVILIERSGIHAGGHYEAKIGGQVVWVPDAPPAGGDASSTQGGTPPK